MEQLIKCLICGQHNSKTEQLKDNDKERSLIDKHLRVIFLLRNVLEVPSSKLVIFLKSHPKLESWLSVCDKCTLLVNQCKSTYQNILDAQRKFENVKQEIIQHLKESGLIKQEISLDQPDNFQDKPVDIVEQIRAFVYQNQYPENINPFISGDQLAYQQLSRKVDKALQQLDEEDDDDDFDNQSFCEANDDLDEDEWIPSDNEGIKKPSSSKSTVRKSRKSPRQSSSKKYKRGTFPCPQCSKTFPLKIYLNKHIRYVHDQRFSNKCPLCSSLFATSTSLAHHQAKCTGTSIPCPIPNCTRKFYSDQVLTRHLRDTHNSSPKPEDPRKMCTVCGKYFRKLSHLSRHINAVHQFNGNFKCDLCGVAKNSNVDLANHRKNCKGESLSCPDTNCLVKCSTQISLSNHIRSTHQLIINHLLPFKCSECEGEDKHFLTFEQLKNHKRKNHRIKIRTPAASQNDKSAPSPIPCPVPECLQKLRSELGLKRHMTQFHDPKRVEQKRIQNTCKFCGKTFPKLSYLNKHVYSVHELNDNLKCDLCGIGRRSAVDLEKHRKNCKGESISCPATGCEMKFINSLSLNTHVMTTHKDKVDDLLPFKCEECGGDNKGFLSLQHLKSHVKWEHRKKRKRRQGAGGQQVEAQVEKEKGPWVCETCGGSYPTRVSLRNHRRKNLTCGELRGLEKRGPPVICEICGGSFKSKLSLGLHVKVVHERRFTMTCEICGQGKNGKARMELHMWQKHKMGDGGKWVCGVEGCTVKLYGRKEREDHMKKHRGEKPNYKCEECGKGFYMWANIRQHVNEVHKGRRAKRGSGGGGGKGVKREVKGDDEEESNDS